MSENGKNVSLIGLIMKCAITAQTAQSHLGNNKTLAQLKVCIVMSIHNMEQSCCFEHVDSEFS